MTEKSKLVGTDGKPLVRNTVCPNCGGSRKTRANAFGTPLYNCSDCGQELPDAGGQ